VLLDCSDHKVKKMSGSLFTPEGTIDTSKLEGMSQEDIMQMLATQKASSMQGKTNPFSMYQQAMQMQKQQMPGQAPAPQIRRGQAANILSPYDELMKMQQMQMMRQRPQSLL
jgi:hypothetical protein